MAELSELLARAADPATPRAELAVLAHEHPEARAAIAANPSTYDGLLVWLGQLGDGAVNTALQARQGASGLDAPSVVDQPLKRNLGGAPLATPLTSVRALLARVPRAVTITASLAVVAIVATGITSFGAVSAAQRELDAAINYNDQRQADAYAEAEQEASEVEEVAAETPPRPPTPSADGRQIEWTTTTPLGYSITSTVTWGEVSRGEVDTVHPRSPSFTLGSGCGFEPTKDAFVAGVWTVTNSTDAYDLALGSQMSIKARTGTAGVSVELEWITSGGANCGFSTLPFAASVESNSAIAPGQSIASPIFIIIKNYYSPAFPDGAIGELANINVTEGFIGGGASAPLVLLPE